MARINSKSILYTKMVDRLPREFWVLFWKRNCRGYLPRWHPLLGKTSLHSYLTAASLEQMLDGSWIENYVDFHNYLFANASGLCSECFNQAASEDSDLIDQCIEWIAERGLTAEMAWLCFVMWICFDKSWHLDRQCWEIEQEDAEGGDFD